MGRRRTLRRHEGRLVQAVPQTGKRHPEVLAFRQQFDNRNPRDEIIREGARKMLQAAIDTARSAEFSVHGTEGKLACRGRGGTLTYWRPSSTVDEDAPLIETAVDTSAFPQRNSHQHWIDCIQDGTQPPLSHARMARHITEIMLAGLESSRQGRTVEVGSRAE